MLYFLFGPWGLLVILFSLGGVELDCPGFTTRVSVDQAEVRVQCLIVWDPIHVCSMCVSLSVILSKLSFMRMISASGICTIDLSGSSFVEEGLGSNVFPLKYRQSASPTLLV